MHHSNSEQSIYDEVDCTHGHACMHTVTPAGQGKANIGACLGNNEIETDKRLRGTPSSAWRVLQLLCAFWCRRLEWAELY